MRAFGLVGQQTRVELQQVREEKTSHLFCAAGSPFTPSKRAHWQRRPLAFGHVQDNPLVYSETGRG
jgi:hypothetical protein